MGVLWEIIPVFVLFGVALCQDGVPRSPVVLIRQTGPAAVEAQPVRHDAGFGRRALSAPLFPGDGVVLQGQGPFLPQQALPVLAQPQQVLAVQPIFGPAGIVAPPPPAVNGCPNPVPVRPPDSARCKWYPIYDALACVVDYECGEPDCPNSPVRPDSATNCEWLEIKDRTGCIVDWECEPLNAAGCPGAPPKPDDGGRCRWTPVKNDQGCVFNWFCTPVLPGPPPLGPFGGFGGFPPPAPRDGDEHPFCCYWASNGDCHKNPLFMRTKCRKSCGTPHCKIDEAETCKVHLNLVGCSLNNPRPPLPLPTFPGPVTPFKPLPLPLPLNPALGIPPLPFKPFPGALPPRPLPNPFLPKPFPRPPLGPFPFAPRLGRPFGPLLPKPLPSFPNFGPFFNGGNPFNTFFGPKTLPPLKPFGVPALTGPRFDAPLAPRPFRGPLPGPLPLGGPVPFPFSPFSPRICVNKSGGCQIWALLGHCSSRARFMADQCAKSCGACSFLKKKKKKK